MDDGADGLSGIPVADAGRLKSEMGSVERPLTERRWLADAALLLVVVAPGLAAASVGRGEPTAQLAGAVTAAAVLGLRRSRPAVGLILGLLAAVVATFASGEITAVVPASLVLLFVVSEQTDRRTAALSAALVTAVLHLSVTVGAGSPGFGAEALATLAWPALAAAAGDAVRLRRQYLAEVAARTHRAAEAQAAEARRLMLEQRIYIARELHDVLAHGVAVISVQAGTAEHLLRDDVDAAERALQVVRSTAAGVLEEVGGIVRLLRSDVQDLDRPSPGMTDIEPLIHSFQDAGLSVDWDGVVPEPVAPNAELALYRTLQESLTNAQRHGTGTAWISITRNGNAIHLQVENPTRASRPDADLTAGHGLTGMAERVRAVGGSVQASSHRGTFRIDARVPGRGDE